MITLQVRSIVTSLLDSEDITLVYYGSRTKWYEQNGMDKMVYGQNGIGQNGMDKMVRTKWYG